MVDGLPSGVRSLGFASSRAKHGEVLIGLSAEVGQAAATPAVTPPLWLDVYVSGIRGPSLESQAVQRSEMKGQHRSKSGTLSGYGGPSRLSIGTVFFLTQASIS